MRNRSLFDRFLGVGVFSDTDAFDRHVAYESVRSNLARIVNARQGMAAAQTDYGLPEISIAEGLGPAVQQLRLAVAANVRLYEPRLADVNVLPAEVGDGDRPAVLVEGRHISDPNQDYVAFVIICEKPGFYQVALA